MYNVIIQAVNFLLKCIEILLRSDLCIALVLIIAAFCVHIVHYPDCE